MFLGYLGRTAQTRIFSDFCGSYGSLSIRIAKPFPMMFAGILILVIISSIGHATPAMSRVVNKNTVVCDPVNYIIITNLFISSTAVVFVSWVSFIIQPINSVKAQYICYETKHSTYVMTQDGKPT